MTCTHHVCRCARARELAEMELILEAIQVHNERVRCREER